MTYYTPPRGGIAIGAAGTSAIRCTSEGALRRGQATAQGGQDLGYAADMHRGLLQHRTSGGEVIMGAPPVRSRGLISIRLDSHSRLKSDGTVTRPEEKRKGTMPPPFGERR